MSTTAKLIVECGAKGAPRELSSKLSLKMRGQPGATQSPRAPTIELKFSKAEARVELSKQTRPICSLRHQSRSLESPRLQHSLSSAQGLLQGGVVDVAGSFKATSNRADIARIEIKLELRGKPQFRTYVRHEVATIWNGRSSVKSTETGCTALPLSRADAQVARKGAFDFGHSRLRPHCPDRAARGCLSDA